MKYGRIIWPVHSYPEIKALALQVEEYGFDSVHVRAHKMSDVGKNGIKRYKRNKTVGNVLQSIGFLMTILGLVWFANTLDSRLLGLLIGGMFLMGVGWYYEWIRWRFSIYMENRERARSGYHCKGCGAPLTQREYEQDEGYCGPCYCDEDGPLWKKDVPCQYCGALMPITGLYCPKCGGKVNEGGRFIDKRSK